MHTSEQDRAGKNRKSGQEVAKNKNGKLAKTDVRYWQSKLIKVQYTFQGERRETTEWCVRIQYLGRRETFPLGTPNQTAAAARARDIYLNLQGAGWDATISRFKPKAEGIQQKPVATVGEFLTEVRTKTSGKAKTIEDYSRAFRTIVAQICGIDGGKEKFDYSNGGRAKWLARIERVKLTEITPEEVLKWKLAFLKRAGTDPVKQRSSRVSVNSLIRQAKSLFAPDILKFVQLDLPSGTPFDGVAFEPRPSMRYRSSFSVEEVIRKADEELPREQFKILLLAAMAGLRRNEIDKLEWSAIRWREGVIRIQATRYFDTKSEESAGDVEIDPELLELFRDFHARARGEFVIESEVAPRPGTTYSHYRCQNLFEKLTRWLRGVGVTGNNPLHTLRKEYGSQVCAQHGIYAASHALRHADINITSQHYLDKKNRITAGLGHLLKQQSACERTVQDTPDATITTLRRTQ